MIIKSLELQDFRNYESLKLEFDGGTNIFYGDNAQGKTNILEAIFMLATTKSHKGAKDQDMIRFEKEEAHIRSFLFKEEITRQIDLHLRKGKSKGIAIDSQRVKKAADLLGLLHVVFFSPEDLSIIKNSPAERRRFIDMELCQLDSFYLYNLSHYNQILNQRNKLLKEMAKTPELSETLSIWDSQLASYGSKVIERREAFIKQLSEIIKEKHRTLSGEREDLELIYEKNVDVDNLEEKIRENRQKDIYLKQTTTGPHRDDMTFLVNGIDIRKFGSQGQQRTAALSLKLSEIEIVKKSIHDTPVLLLDDVLSELDSNRQNYLLSEIKDIQTLITCTGLDEFVKNRFEINKVFKVTNGSVKEMSGEGNFINA